MARLVKGHAPEVVGVNGAVRDQPRHLPVHGIQEVVVGQRRAVVPDGANRRLVGEVFGFRAREPDGARGQRREIDIRGQRLAVRKMVLRLAVSSRSTAIWQSSRPGPSTAVCRASARLMAAPHGATPLCAGFITPSPGPVPYVGRWDGGATRPGDAGGCTGSLSVLQRTGVRGCRSTIHIESGRLLDKLSRLDGNACE